MQEATILQMRGVRKAFGPVVALDGANFQLNDQEIHGLLGGNGAGKTTLMNILYGLYRPDAGEIHLRGRPVEIHAPRDAIRHGIGMVHQHFLQIDSFTVAQNTVLGTPVTRGLGLNLEEEEQRIRELARRFGLDVDPHALIEDLPIGIRQRVEILKALYRGVDILILDEPTTNLTPQEVDSLFHSLRAMVEEGMSVIFITHKIREALSVCDRISVMRDGRDVLTVGREEASEETLVRAMVGEELDIRQSFLFAGERAGHEGEVAGRPVLQVENLGVVADDGTPLVRGCTFQVHEGEILGVAGVAGNGQRELAESLVGLRPVAQGQVLIDGTRVQEVGTAHLLQMGVTYIPEDRLSDGFLPAASVAQNLILGFHRQAPYNRGGLLDWKAVFQVARRLIAEYDIRTPGPAELAANLSGGNIQRLMLARAFSHPSRLIVAHNPTRGLDIPSTEFVYSRLLELKKQGTAILLISEDLDELLLLCDRIAVIYRGQIVGTLEQAAFDRYEIGRMMSGVRTVERAGDANGT